jgi:hypothetical protein
MNDLADVIVIGSPTDLSVCVYVKNGSSYPLLAQVFAPDDGIDSTGFGEHVSIDAAGNQFIVHVANRTIAYVYTIENGSVNLTQTLIPSVSSQIACAGGVMSADGSTIVMAAINNSAVVFKKTNSIFIESQIIDLGTLQLSNLYNAFNQISTSGDGSVLLLGCGESSRALLFIEIDNQLVLAETLTPTNGTLNDKFGRSTTISRNGKRAIVGAPENSYYATKAGAAYLYQ